MGDFNVIEKMENWKIYSFFNKKTHAPTQVFLQSKCYLRVHSKTSNLIGFWLATVLFAINEHHFVSKR